MVEQQRQTLSPQRLVQFDLTQADASCIGALRVLRCAVEDCQVSACISSSPQHTAA
jgi:hypothetical protein